MIAPMDFANTKYWPNRYLPDIAGQIDRKMTERAFFFQCEDYWVQSVLRLAERHEGLARPQDRARRN
jgi:hypothetical protein